MTYFRFWRRGTAAAIALAGLAQAGLAKADTVTIGVQPGLPHLVMMVMEDQHFVEQQLAAEGLGADKVSYFLENGGAQTDGLLSGQLDFASFGVSNLATLWSASHGAVKAIAAEDAIPNQLVTADPNIKSLKDLKPGDKIAVPTVGVSPQSIMLRIASEKTFGTADHFNTMEVAMSPADAAISLLAGANTITAHFSIPPYQEQELADPKIHSILSSYQLLGGPATVVVNATTKSYYNSNPKVVKAFLAAEDQAIALIKQNPQKAAEIYLSVSHDKKTPAEEIVKILQDPQVIYSRTPMNVKIFIDFMYQQGMIKTGPKSISDLFFPIADLKNGS